MDIFAVVSNHIDWLGQRQAITAANIANSDTPNFKAKDIQPFHLQMQDLQISLQQTQAGHMQDQSVMTTGYEIRDQHNSDSTHSGNDVVIEKEMLNVGETSRQFTFDTAIAKIFHRMMMSSVKS